MQKRKYRRTQKSLGPRTYRTHPDPFEAVRSELHRRFLAAPDRPVKCLLQELQARYPGRYPGNLLRTLQRRVREWRREVIPVFDDGLIREDALLHQSLPVPLRAIPVKDPTSSSVNIPSQTVQILIRKRLVLISCIVCLRQFMNCVKNIPNASLRFLFLGDARQWQR